MSNRHFLRTLGVRLTMQFAGGVLCLAAVAGAAPVSIYVDGVLGDDASATCAEGDVYRTIQAAASCALDAKKDGTSTTIIIRAGTYREAVSLWLDPVVYADNMTPIVFSVEAGHENQVTVKGSDRVEGWVDEGDGLYSLVFPSYPLSLSPQLPAGQPQMPDITRRREMVFADGQYLAQVEFGTPQANGDGTFAVAPDGTITIAPHDGVLDEPGVEVAVRDHAFKLQHVHNVSVVGGITFAHAATPWENGKAAVVFSDCKQATCADNRVVWNNGDGLWLGNESTGSRISRTEMNRCGKSGIGTFRAYDLVVAECETSRNNWRGALGGYYGWWLGNKFTYSRGLTVRDHLSAENESRGLWIDLDNEDVWIENAVVERNLKDGIFLEASQGPITIRNSRFAENGEHGVKGANAERVTLCGVTSVDNALEQIRLTADGGDGPRDVQNHQTGQTMTLWLKEWTIHHCVFGRDDGGQPPLLRSTLLDGGTDDWSLFLADFDADLNCWYHGLRADVFEVDELGATLDLAGWQLETGQEAGSTYHSTGATCAASCEVVSVGESTPVPALAAPRLAARANPYASTLRLSVDLPVGSMATLEVYTVDGRFLLSRELGWLAHGHHEVALDDPAARSARGVRLVRLRTEQGATATLKVVRLP